MDLLSIIDINYIVFNNLSSALDYSADNENSTSVLTSVNKLKIKLIMILIIKKLKTLICCFGTPI